MRCTRCDGLAVPQAVGIASDGRVVFGWCPRCLVETRCDLVEISAKGMHDLKLSFAPPPGDAASGGGASAPRLTSAGVDQTIWLVGLVGFLMLAWGSAVIIAGLLMDPEAPRPANPLGNGSAPLLRVGGGATILLGLLFLTMAANRDREFRRRLIRIVRWGGVGVSMAISTYAILTGGIQRNTLPVSWAMFLPLILSFIAYLIDERERRVGPPVNPWDFPVVSYSEPARPEGPRKRI